MGVTLGVIKMNLNHEHEHLNRRNLAMNGIEIRNCLEVIAQSVLHDKGLLKKTHPSWNQKDARFTSLNNLFISLERTRLGTVFLDDLTNPNWFIHHSPSMRYEVSQELAINFEKMVKYNFGMDFFTGIETSFRIFLRAIDPIACDNGSGPFINIYGSLLDNQHLNFQDTERDAAIELLNLSRLLRNLNHNSGVYFSKNGIDETTDYKEKIYKFEHNKLVNFVYWELLIDLADEIHQLLVTVINHPKIVSIPNIQDPYHTEYNK